MVSNSCRPRENGACDRMTTRPAASGQSVRPHPIKVSTPHVRPGRLAYRESIACHEAGHAVAAYLVRRPFGAVSIAPRGDAAGYCEFSANLDQDLAVSSRSKSAENLPRTTRRRLENAIIVAYGGLAAEYLLVGRHNWKGAVSDMQQASNAGMKLVNLDKLRPYLSSLLPRTKVLLRRSENWAAVQALMAALLEQLDLALQHYDGPEEGALRAEQAMRRFPAAVSYKRARQIIGDARQFTAANDALGKE